MAKVQLHPAFDGFSGKSDGMVFRRVRGQTVIAQRPQARKHKATAAQQKQRDRFAAATAYAQEVLADPWQRKAFERLAQSLDRRADKIATSDFLTPPVVDGIDVFNYKRQPGATIRVLATDDVEVVSVEVTIKTAAGSVVERGAATPLHGVWSYRTTVTAPAKEALTVTATARDRPNHIGTLSVVAG